MKKSVKYLLCSQEEAKVIIPKLFAAKKSTEIIHVVDVKGQVLIKLISKPEVKYSQAVRGEERRVL